MKRLAFALTLTCGLAVAAHADWPQIINGASSQFDSGQAVAVDLLGNVYVSGTINTSVTAGDDMITVKYDRFGVQQWSNIWNSFQNGNEAASKIVVDSNNNVTVLGSSTGIGTFDVVVISYDPNGATRWSTIIEGPEQKQDFPGALAVDANGNIGMAFNAGTTGGSDIVTIKFNSTGTYKWGAVYTGAGDNSDLAHGLAFDTAGNLYLGGTTYNGGNYYDYVVVKYSANGNKKWTRTVDAVNSLDDLADLCVDNAGNVLVTGTSDGPNGSSDVLTAKYDTNGIKLWQCRVGTANIQEFAKDMVLDADGNAYVCGTSGNDGEFSDVLTMKISNEGIKQWSKIYTAQPKNFSGDTGVAIDIDNAGVVYVAAALRENNSSEGDLYGCLKYSSAGTLMGQKRFGIDGVGGAAPSAIAVDRVLGKAYITGFAANQATSSFDIATAKF